MNAADFFDLIGMRDYSGFSVFLFRLVLAGILGAIVGLDRAYHAKDAGLRTHFLVAVGSALIMIISQHGFYDLMVENGNPNIRLDVSRVASQIVSGIGFIGAGTIIFQKRMVKGLTTAAGLWTVAGIGMAIGGGLYALGIAASVLTLVAFEVFRRCFKWLHVENTTAHLSFPLVKAEDLPAIMEQLKKLNCKIVKYSCKQDKEVRIVNMYVRFNSSQISLQDLFMELSRIDGLELEKFE